MRREQTPSERKRWFLFLCAHPVKFRRQVPYEGYILDFYAPVLKLCVELDSPTHDSIQAQEYDAERTNILMAAGIKVIRFSNAEIVWHFEAVCNAIDKACQHLGSP